MTTLTYTVNNNPPLPHQFPQLLLLHDVAVAFEANHPIS
jgi:hypothetical protein